MYRGFEGTWKTIADRKTLQCPARAPVLVHLLNDELIAATCDRQLTLLTTSGQQLMHESGEKGETFAQRTAITPDGRFFALGAFEFEFEYPALVVRIRKARVLVYDVVQRRQIASLHPEPTPKLDVEYAVSLDGKRLAMILDDQLRVVPIAAQ